MLFPLTFPEGLHRASYQKDALEVNISPMYAHSNTCVKRLHLTDHHRPYYQCPAALQLTVYMAVVVNMTSYIYK